MEARKLIEMFSEALRTLLSKIKGPSLIEVGVTSIYQGDFWIKALFICLIAMLTIILVNLIRPSSKQQHIQSTSSYKL